MINDVNQQPIIREKYKEIEKDLKNFSSTFEGYKKIDKKYYEFFKKSIEKSFPDFISLLLDIEKLFNFDTFDDYFRQKEREIPKLSPVSPVLLILLVFDHRFAHY